MSVQVLIVLRTGQTLRYTAPTQASAEHFVAEYAEAVGSGRLVLTAGQHSAIAVSEIAAVYHVKPEPAVEDPANPDTWLKRLLDAFDTPRKGTR